MTCLHFLVDVIPLVRTIYEVPSLGIFIFCVSSLGFVFSLAGVPCVFLDVGVDDGHQLAPRRLQDTQKENNEWHQHAPAHHPIHAALDETGRGIQISVFYVVFLCDLLWALLLCVSTFNRTSHNVPLIVTSSVSKSFPAWLK